MTLANYAYILSQEERAHISGLTRSEILSYTASKAEHHRQAMQAYLSIHNDAVPIHRLPTETLSYIFARSWHNKYSCRMSHVCRRWRAVLLRTSAFWGDLSNEVMFDLNTRSMAIPWGHSFKFMKTLFKRCTLRGINLHLNHFHHLFSGYMVRHQQALLRIVSLHVQFFDGHEFQPLFELLNAGMPSLKELVVVISHTMKFVTISSEIAKIPQPLQSSSVPCLRTLSTSQAMFPLLACDSVENVTLRYPAYHWEQELSLPSLCANLRRCSGLRSLKLDLVAFDDFDEIAHPEMASDGSTAYPIALPKLEDLVIVHSPERNRIMLSMLSRIFYLPSLTHLHVKQWKLFVNPADETLNWLLAQDSYQARKLLPGVDQVEIEEDDENNDPRGDNMSNVTIRVLSKKIERVRITHFRRRSRAGDFIAIFRPYTTITHLSIHANDHLADTGAETFFRAFPQLLSLRIATPSTEKMLAALQVPDDPNDPQLLVSASLKMLDISFPFSKSDAVWLKRSLEDREWHSNSQQMTEHLRNRCSVIRKTLEHRAALGSRLESLEWSEFEYDDEDDQDWERLDTVIVDLPSELENQGVTTDYGMAGVRNLVEGQVTFKSFAFYREEYHIARRPLPRKPSWDDLDAEEEPYL